MYSPISTFGLLGKHPTTGGAIASPFVGMSQNYQKQASLIWYEIFDIVKQNLEVKPDSDGEERIFLMDVVVEMDMKFYIEETKDIMTVNTTY